MCVCGARNAYEHAVLGMESLVRYIVDNLSARHRQAAQTFEPSSNNHVRGGKGNVNNRQAQGKAVRGARSARCSSVGQTHSNACGGATMESPCGQCMGVRGSRT